MIYAEVTKLNDRFQVDIHPEDLYLEAVNYSDIPGELRTLGYYPKDEFQIDDHTWHIMLSDAEEKEKGYSGYGLVISYHKVTDVMSVFNSGRSKDGRHLLPIPGSELAKESRQYNNAIVYQNKDYHAVWSESKQTLDILRRKTLEWRRNHQFRIERFI